jgi:hypothetical protein
MQVRAHIQDKKAARAHEAINVWFAEDTSPEVLEEKARAYELDFAACDSNPCRLAAITNAKTARATPERDAQAAAVRARLLESIATERVTEKAVLPRLQQLRESELVVAETLTRGESLDGEVQLQAKTTASFIEQERAKVPLLGNELAVADVLLAPRKTNEKGVPVIAIGGAFVYLVPNSAGKCTGVYAIGLSGLNRSIRSQTWPAQRILSQALGRAATIKPPAKGSSTSQWYEGGVLVVARWRFDEVAELRIGNATP